MIDAWPDEKWVPDSCCLPANYDLHCGKIKDSGLYMQGCFSQIYNWFLQRLDIIGVVGLMVAFLQVSMKTTKITSYLNYDKETGS